LILLFSFNKIDKGPFCPQNENMMKKTHNLKEFLNKKWNLKKEMHFSK